jgi:PmbA protein
MNKSERLELARWAVAQARKSGASDAAADLAYSRDIEVQYRDGTLEQLKESVQNSLTLSVYANSRYSVHSSNDLRKPALEKFIGEAVAMTQYLAEDPFRSLPDPKYYAGQKQLDLHLYDPAYDNLASDARVKIAREIEEIAHAQGEKIISCTSYYSDSSYGNVMVRSNGFEGEAHHSGYSSGAEVTVDDGKGGRPAGSFFTQTRFLKKLPTAEYVGKEAAKDAFNRVGQAKMASGQYDMVILNRSGNRLLFALYGAMQGRALQQKTSYLDGKVGQKIASEKLTMVDDPFVDTGLGSRLFDSEGMAAKRLVMIDKGVLKGYYINWYYGRKLKMEPTTASYSNVVFEYGQKSFDDMVKGMKKGIVVTDFIGGNSNPTTGDFSFGIIGAYYEDGKLIRPVNEMNISGNLLDIWNQLVEVGNDPWEYSAMRRPSMLFTGVQFSGV